jgi:hypothetical protein
MRRDVRSSAGTRDISLLHSVEPGSGVYPSSYPMGNVGSFPRVKRLGLEADHLNQSSGEVKNSGAVPPLSHFFFMV